MKNQLNAHFFYHTLVMIFIYKSNALWRAKLEVAPSSGSFLNTFDIHRHLCELYGDGIMREGGMRHMCIMLEYGRTSVHNEDRSGCPSLVTDEMTLKISEKIPENHRFTIAELSFEFLQICIKL
ncbi:hypothetical protein AVEN_151608-1 [Araneus ventricosus]|uniref:Uncharacterized protein n=1 Tax=Araneus ventricosus TaxID=182803 RepID=A0A4Y2UE73_ARAVE|nr:hypothetical protein AVEN_151608-1 [Araneus ventricosus]